MSSEIKAAIRATVKALKAEVATDRTEPHYEQLFQAAIEAAEKVVGTDAGPPARKSRSG